MDHNCIEESVSDLITVKRLELFYDGFYSVIQGLKKFKWIYIYGAGGWGISLKNLLDVYSIKIDAFFDKRADGIDTHNSVPVLNLALDNATEKRKKESLIIIAVKLENQKSIASSLVKSGYINYMTINGIWHYGCWASKDELFSLIHKKVNMLKCTQIWTDQKSLNIYYEQIKCYLSRRYNTSNQIDRVQYFPNDIIFEKGYSNFVDCGAYTGDTVATLAKSVGKIRKLIALEPDAENFSKLTTNIATEKDNIAEEIYLYPCGIWSSSSTLAFNNTQGPSCHISALGNNSLPCVSLDDILVSFIPTFIKMDIEGSEIEAIKGASKTISQYKPDLAISVYHKIEHLWEIPILLKSLHSDYKFYLRSYEHFNQETILYAV